MRLFRMASILLLLLVSCEKELTEGRYFGIQRQKVADAMAAGLSEDYPVEIGETVDFCLDKAGKVRFMGTLEKGPLLEKAALLNGSLPAERYRELLEEVSGCIHIGMYYDGRTDAPAAVFTLREIRLKDNFGTFLAYTLVFRFSNSMEIGVREFFESKEFYPYRTPLFDYIKKLMDVLQAS
jgi:hypothetical protein